MWMYTVALKNPPHAYRTGFGIRPLFRGFSFLEVAADAHFLKTCHQRACAKVGFGTLLRLGKFLLNVDLARGRGRARAGAGARE